MPGAGIHAAVGDAYAQGRLYDGYNHQAMVYKAHPGGVASPPMMGMSAGKKRVSHSTHAGKDGMADGQLRMMHL